MRKSIGWLATIVASALLSVSLVGSTVQASSNLSGQSIIVVSREAGSGTRGAFVELAQITDQYGDDNLTVEADVLNTTGGVMQVVASNPAAIGYISLGSVNATVKALTLDGVAASAQTVQAGQYPLARPFNLAWKKDQLTPLAMEFLTYVYSQEGQSLVEKSGYIGMGEQTKWQGRAVGSYAYQAQQVSGDLKIVGSTSLTPVIEKLAEHFEALNPGVKVNITSNGSTAGLAAAIEGTADLGMASRELSASEHEQLTGSAFALDAIVVVVNPTQSLSDISLMQLREIYNGTKVEW